MIPANEWRPITPAVAQERYNRATSQRLDAEAFDDLRRENADLKRSVIAFAAPWVVQWARDHGWPEGHLHPDHYDLLVRCGARMDDFTRGGGARMSTANEWRPISTAPRDGTHILVWRPRVQGPCVAVWNGEPPCDDMVTCIESGKCWIGEWWMPLDAIPAPQRKGGGG